MVTDMQNGGVSARVANYLDSKPGNFIASGRFLYPTSRIKGIQVTDLQDIAAFLHWGLSNTQIVDIKQFCDQSQ